VILLLNIPNDQIIEKKLKRETFKRLLAIVCASLRMPYIQSGEFMKGFFDTRSSFFE